jgi:hypothetical protein
MVNAVIALLWCMHIALGVMIVQAVIRPLKR